MFAARITFLAVASVCVTGGAPAQSELASYEFVLAQGYCDVGDVGSLKSVLKGRTLSELGLASLAQRTFGSRTLPLQRAEILAMLLDTGLPSNSFLYGSSLLELAAKQAPYEVVKLLIDRGAVVDDPALRPARGEFRLALHLGIVFNTPDVVRLLLERGASATEACGRTSGYIRPPTMDAWFQGYGQDHYPLQLAAYHGRADLIPVLLGFGARVNAWDREGETALHCAALQPENAETIRTLLRLGATRTSRTGAGETPMDIARRKGYASNLAALEYGVRNFREGFNDHSGDYGQPRSEKGVAGGW